MNHQTNNKLARRERWEVIVSNWEQSNLSKVKYCKDNNLTLSAFYSWFRKLRTDVESQVLVPKSKKINFIPVAINHSKLNTTAQKASSDLIIRLPNKVEIIIPQLENGLSFIDYVNCLKEV